MVAWLPFPAKRPGGSEEPGWAPQAEAILTQIRQAIDTLESRIKSDTVQITPSGAGVATSVNVPFTKPFPVGVVPKVVVGVNTGVSSDIELKVWASSETRTGFTLTLRRGNTTPTWVTWIATDLPA